MGRRIAEDRRLGGHDGHEPAELDPDRPTSRTSPSTSSRPSRSGPTATRGRKPGHEREPRVSVSRSIFALTDERDWAYFGGRGTDEDQIGYIDASTQAIFGRSYAAEPDKLIEQLKEDEAIAAADTLLLTVPNQLGVEYNAHVIESVLTHVAPGLGWR